MSPPLIHRIETGKGRYIYDTATSRAFGVSRYIYDNAERLSSSSREDILGEAPSSSPPDEPEQSWELVRKQKDDLGCFAQDEPTIGMYVTRSEIEKAARERIAQVVLEVTEQCNLRCRYCTFSGGYPNTREHGRRSMDRRTAFRAVDLVHQSSRGLAEGKNVAIGFTGGEPMLAWPLIQDTVRYALDKDWGHTTLTFNMTTNATLVREEHVDFFMEHDLHPAISLDGPRHVHDRNRVRLDSGNRATVGYTGSAQPAHGSGSGRGSYDDAMRMVEMIRSKNLQFFRTRTLFSTVISHPVDWLELNEFLNDELGLHSSQVLVAGVRAGGDTPYSHDEAARSAEQIGVEELEQRFVEAAIAGALFGHHEPGDPKHELQRRGKTCLTFPMFVVPQIKLFRRPIYRAPWKGHTISHRGCCIPPSKRMLVNADGEIYPCDRIDYNTFTRVGDIDRGVDVDAVEAMLRGFYGLVADHCSKCWALRLCGQCLVTCVGKDRFERSLKLVECEATRADVGRRLAMHLAILEQNPDAFDDQGEVAFDDV